MNRSAFILFSAIFFIFIAISRNDHFSGRGFGHPPIPTNITMSLAKPDGLIPESKPSVLIRCFNTFSPYLEEATSANSFHSPPVSISHGAAKIPNSKYLGSVNAINYLLAILPRRYSDNPLLL